MAKKGTRKSKEKKEVYGRSPVLEAVKKAKKATAKPSSEVKAENTPIIEPETGAGKAEVAQQLFEERSKIFADKPILPSMQPQMVSLRAKIHDVGMLTKTMPTEKVDEELEKIWRTGFKQKFNNRQRTHRVYGPHTIDRIDVEPIYP